MTVSTLDRHAELRLRVREWLEGQDRPVLPPELDARFEAQRRWQGRLYEAGWLGFGWPEEYGGRGSELVDQVVVNQEMARFKAPSPAGSVGLEIIGPTILDFGTAEQKARFLPSLLDGSEIWCQGFSEPDAGSDLASLRTRARPDADALLVSGQKTWTSSAQYARWCALLVRTGTAEQRHRGLTYLLVDMQSPGISIRPLEQMTGDEEFSEVFFDDVRVPAENVLGELNGGWACAMATLGFERGLFALRRQVELRVALDELAGQAHGIATSGAALEAADLRRRLGECEVLVEVLAAHGERTLKRIVTGEAPHESSVDKLLLTRVDQQLYALGLELLGPYRTVTAAVDGLDRARWISGYLYSRAASIYGGTSEIQRNVIAERILGLGRGG